MGEKRNMKKPNSPSTLYNRREPHLICTTNGTAEGEKTPLKAHAHSYLRKNKTITTTTTKTKKKKKRTIENKIVDGVRK